MAWKINRPRGPWETESASELVDRKRGGRRPLMVTIEPLCVVYRPKGTRQSVRITHAKVYELACMAEAEANRKRRPSVRRGVLRGP